jgi:hypothetical protein
MVALGLAMVEGVARLRRLAQRKHWGDSPMRFVIGFTGACALAATVAWGPSPLGVDFHNGYWPLAVPADATARDHMMPLIGGHDGISADYYTVPHLTHRSIVYTFPNPWENKNYGITPTAIGDPAKVKWILVDTNLFQTSDAVLFNRLIATEFTVRMKEGTVVLAERTRPPSTPTGPSPP